MALINDTDLPLWSNTKSVSMTWKISILGGKSVRLKKKYIDNPFTFLQKICISPNFKEENRYFCQILRIIKSVYTDKISMSGRSKGSLDSGKDPGRCEDEDLQC